MAADGVLDDLDQRVHVDVVELARTGRAGGTRRPSASGWWSRRGPRSRPSSSLRRLKARKSEHCLPSTSMIWMYSPGLDLVGDGAWPASTRKSSRGSASGGGSSTSLAAAASPARPRPAAARRASRRPRPGPPGAATITIAGRARRRNVSRLARAASGVEQPQRQRVVGDQPARVQLQRASRRRRRRDQPAQHGSPRRRAVAERRRVLAALGVEHGQLGDLAAVVVDDGEPVAGLRAARRSPRPGAPSASPASGRPASGRREHRGPVATAIAHQAFAGSFASAFSASATSCSASSRLPSASSFLTSFSTTRRL